jgi:hypothetical protein
MALRADDEGMTAVLILLIVLGVLLLSIPFGADSRRTGVNGHHRPNWL